MLKLSRLVVLTLFLAAIAVEGNPQQATGPTLIFYNGQVVTMEPDFPVAQALAVQGEKILAVGSNEDILVLRQHDTPVVDLAGKALLPGFVDPHNHLFNDAANVGLSLEQVQGIALSYGYTTVSNMFSLPHFVEEMSDFEQVGGLHLRTSLYLTYNDPCGRPINPANPTWYRQYPQNINPKRMLRIVGVKIFSDGGLCGTRASSYINPVTGTKGNLWLSQEELSRVVGEAQAAGYSVAIHATGDRAIETAQNAITAALSGRPNSWRHRIEHNTILRPDLVPRCGEIDIIHIGWAWYPTCDVVHQGCSPHMDCEAGPERLSWVTPWRAVLDANPGLHASWHTDLSLSPWADIIPFNPLLHLYGWVTGNERDLDGGVCEAPDWLVATRVTVQEALPMMTRESAYAIFMDEAVGSLKPGKFADFVVLSDNPLTIPSDRIKDIRLLSTIIGGETQYDQGRTPFIGRWRGLDNDDGSRIVLLLTQQDGRLEAFFEDAFSRLPDGTEITPGFGGWGSGTVISPTEGQMTFDLKRSDGATITLEVRLVLSELNQVLALTDPIVNGRRMEPREVGTPFVLYR